MKKEFGAVAIIGLFLLSYALEAVIDPLNLGLTTPYAYADSSLLATYPFSSAIVLIRTLAVFLTPLYVLSWFKGMEFAKGAILLVLAALMQLYAIQDVVTESEAVTLEWALSLAFAGVLLLIPAIYYMFKGGVKAMGRSMKTTAERQAALAENQGEAPEWLEEEEFQE